MREDLFLFLARVYAQIQSIRVRLTAMQQVGQELIIS